MRDASRPTLDLAWYDAIAGRRSRRRFDGTPVPPDPAAALLGLCDRFRPFPDARAVFVAEAPEGLFTGIAGSYGAVRGAPSAGLFVASGPDGEVSAGYVGEALVLEAASLGLGTCWVAGMFDHARAASIVELGPQERIVAVTPVGTATATPGTAERLMRTFVRAARRMEPDEIAPGLAEESWPGWATLAVDAARLAPSGGNGQPWRFRMQEGALVLYLAESTYWTARMDMGIAMLHAELGAMKAGVSGTWERLADPDVARFAPSPGAG